MLRLFFEGGTLFMGTLSIILACIIALGAYILFDQKSIPIFKERAGLIRSLGLFAFMVGIFGQLIGLFSAFQYIEKVGQISPQMLAGGIRVSSITTIYGMSIFIVAYLISFALLAYQNRGQN